MWNNYRSYILLVHIKQRKKLGFMIPLAIPVLEVTLDSLRESLEIWESLLPGLSSRLIRKIGLGPTFRRQQMTDTVKKSPDSEGNRLKLSQLFTWCIIFLNELRQLGRFEFVHVDDGNNHISIKLL